MGMMEAVLERAQGLWRSSLLTPALKRSLTPGARAVTEVWATPHSYRSYTDNRKAGPLIVSGFFGEPFGVARAVAMSADALETAGLPVVRHAIRPLLDEAGLRAGALPGEDPGGVWLAHCNPPEALAVFARLPRAQWEGRYRIGYWAWELPKAPSMWRRFTRMFHEVWVPSRFVADALGGSLAKIRVMPHPIPHPVAPAPQPERFGLDPKRVWFLAMADFLSSPVRKNPMGAVHAYLTAFPEEASQAGLVIKASRAGADPESFAALKAASAGRTDIILIDEILSDDGMNGLLDSVDVYLSLHRAEGFGLGPAEMFARGKPAIATGFSGNLDFMGSLSDTLVPFSLTPVVDPSGVYRARGQVWAEPNIAVAARRIRRFADEPELRGRIGEAGARRIADMRDAWSAHALADHPIIRLTAESSETAAPGTEPGAEATIERPAE